MHNHPHRTSSTQIANANRGQHRLSADFKANGSAPYTNDNGALPVPNGLQHHMPNGALRHRGTMSLGTFDGPRSPPNTKSKARDLCGMSGQCQAGKACPFSHSTDVSNIDTPCKYFAKGNCKFGAKCALAHILPNGRRVNRPNGPVAGPLSLGGRVDPQSYQKSDPALAHSLLAQQANGISIPFGHQLSPYAENELSLQQLLHDNIPTIETGYTSHSESKYGSPRDENRLPISPSAHLSTLDAPMPASFDSQGISFMARHGPVAASVPSKFGLESPPASLPKKATLPVDAVRNLHSSVYGRDGRDGRARGPDLGSSPLGSGDEGYGQRIMHSKRITKPSVMSASLPRTRVHVNDDWGDGDGLMFGGEEDFLPPSLHDLLTPQEKMRRLSRTDQDPHNLRESMSGIGTPAETLSKFGSPNTGSPSRYGALFARQKQEESNGNNSTASIFGHVGSPLRNSSLHPLASPSLRATKVSGEMSPAFASPPRQSSMSLISQSLAHARISSQATESNENHSPSNHHNSGLQPSSTRHGSLSANPTNRLLSSSSAGGTGRIEEEQGECVFTMEEDEDDHRKRYNGNTWGYSGGKSSPGLGAIGTRRGGGTDGKERWG